MCFQTLSPSGHQVSGQNSSGIEANNKLYDDLETTILKELNDTLTQRDISDLLSSLKGNIDSLLAKNVTIQKPPVLDRFLQDDLEPGTSVQS